MRLSRRVVAGFVLALLVASTTACSQDPEVAKREYLQSGDDYLAEGRIDEAIIQYRNAIQQDARFAEAHRKLAEVAVEKGDVQLAYREFIAAADLLPEDVDIQIRAGQMHLVAQQFEDAQARADRALNLSPDNIDAQILRGQALAGLQDFDAALAQLQRAIELDPESSTSYTTLGGLQAISGNPVEAEAALKRALELDPEYTVARIALANFYLADDQANLAMDTLVAGLTAAPRDIQINQALAYLYLMTGRADEAEEPLRVVTEESDDPQPRFLLADYYYRTDRRAEALSLLDDLAERPETFAAANTRKAAIMSTEGQRADALALLDEVLDSQPNDVGTLVTRSDLMAQDGQLDEALALAEKARTSDPSSYLGHLAAARVHTLMNQADQAIAAYNETLRLSPRLAAARLALAQLYAATGRPADARTHAEGVLTAEPDNPDALLVRAKAQVALGDARDASQPLQQLASQFPDSSAVQAATGTMYAALGNLGAARSAWGRALAVDPVNIEALTGMTQLDLVGNNSAGALARVTATLADHGDSADLLVLAARTHFAVGDMDAAEQVLRRAITIAPEGLQAYSMLGQLYIGQDRLDEAIAEFSEVVRLDPTAIGAHTIIGIMHETTGDTEAARSRYERVLEIDPSAPVAANNLAWIMSESGDNLDLALRWAQTAKTGLPDSPEVNDTLGWIYYKKDLSELAVAPLLISVEKAPDNASFHYHLGLAYQARESDGDVDRARSSLEKALSLDPNFADAVDARQRLAALGGGR